MASITIRNIDDRVKQGLRLRAARNGRSMEEEARLSLERSSKEIERPRLDLAAFIASRFDPLGGIDLHDVGRAEALSKIGLYDDWDGR
jgi:antitoxin FitA